MTPIITVVPNISEGRDPAFLERLQTRLEAVPGLRLMDVSMDQVRNRTIISFTGPQEALFEGGFALYEETLQHVDMRTHEGEYPRIGAVDVFPFVATKDASLEDVVALSRTFAEEVARRFDLPTYLVYESARLPQRRDIEHVREGEYEGFAQKLTDPSWQPDFGPSTFPADKGATMVGARLPQVNLKVYLDTPREEAARWIAQTLASPTSGMPFVKFYPGMDRQRNLAFLNITVGNYRATPLYRVLGAVKTELHRFGATVAQVQIVGLVPRAALMDSALHFLQVADFNPDEILERRIHKMMLDQA